MTQDPHDATGPAPFTYPNGEGVGPYPGPTSTTEAMEQAVSAGRGPYDAPPPLPPYPAQAPADVPADAPAQAPDVSGGSAFWEAQQQAAQAQQAPPPPPPAAPAPPSSGVGAEEGDVDFDAWLAEFTQEQPKVKLWGEWVPIPFDIPLWVTTLIEAGEQNLSTIKRMVDALYGDGQADRWIARGAGEFGLGTVLAWTMLRTRGEKVSFADAARRAQELAEETEREQTRQKEAKSRLGAAAAAGMAPDSPEARAHAAAMEAIQDAGKAPSASTGAQSRPTSTASTGSTGPGWHG